MSTYYDRSNLDRIPDLMELAPRAAAAYLAFEHEIYQTSQVLPAKTKELIAVAVAHITGCPYCIDVHVSKCKALGGTAEEIFEAVLVAASTRAGAVLSHATHALIAFEGHSGSHAAGADSASEVVDSTLASASAAASDSAPHEDSPAGPAAPPDCFC